MTFLLIITLIVWLIAVGIVCALGLALFAYVAYSIVSVIADAWGDRK